jgi:MFS family permease
MSPGPEVKPLLGQRSFAALWWGQLISILGDRLTYLALGGLLLEHTNRGLDPRYPLLLAILGNVMVAPVLMFAPFTGAWVDRQNLQRVLVVSDLLRAVVVLGVPWLYAITGHTGTTFGLVFLLFTCNVFFLPAKSAITPEIVPPGQLLAANSLLAAAGIAATAIGALIGGWVVDHWGWRIAMQIDAATYLVSVFTLALVVYRPGAHVVASVERTGRGYLREVADGWALVKSNSAVGLGLFSLGVVWLGGGFLHVAGNSHIQRAASIPGMERVGVLLAALGVGAAISTWWVTAHGRSLPRGAVMGFGFALGALALVAFAVTSRFAVFSIAAFLVGLFVAPSFVLTETLLQEGTEAHQRARVFSARDFLMRLTFLVSITLAAALARAFGTRTTLLACSGVMLIAGIAAIAWRTGPSSPAGDEARPAS